MSITIKDIRPAHTEVDHTIPDHEAVDGQFYLTVGGQRENIVQAVRFRSDSYRKHIRSDGLAFVHDDGSIYPLTTERLLPLDAEAVWIINNDPTRRNQP